MWHDIKTTNTGYYRPWNRFTSSEVFVFTFCFFILLYVRSAFRAISGALLWRSWFSRTPNVYNETVMDGFVRGDLWCSIGWRVITSPIDFSHSRQKKRLRRWLSSSWRWIYWNFSVFARLWHSSNAVPCVSDWLSLHKKVKLCCPMLETIKYDFSVLVSLQSSCNEYRRSDCRRRPSSAFHVATTRSHAQRNFFFQLAHPDFSNYDLSITQKPRAIKKINWKALLRRPRARASR